MEKSFYLFSVLYVLDMLEDPLMELSSLLIAFVLLLAATDVFPEEAASTGRGNLY